jgi:hypothetical protein
MLYFAYGSNMDSQRLNGDDRLKGDAHPRGPVCTQEQFELEFTVLSKGNGCAAATLAPGSGRTIWGVLYDVPDFLITRETSGNRQSLDAIEGQATNYTRHGIRLNYPGGSPVAEEVITYLARQRTTCLKTNSGYVGHIIRGLREHEAPDEYVDYVKSRIMANDPALHDEIADM